MAFPTSNDSFSVGTNGFCSEGFCRSSWQGAISNNALPRPVFRMGGFWAMPCPCGQPLAAVARIEKARWHLVFGG